jgi:hypothetical protein
VRPGNIKALDLRSLATGGVVFFVVGCCVQRCLD